MSIQIVLKGYIDIPLAELETVIEALEVHKKLTRAEPGCVKFNVRPDKELQGRFSVYEKFASQDAFNAHQERVKKSEWGEVSKNVERHYEINEIED
ncbi:MAG: antibiotic biosynthesis monooxygenase [Hyphomonadaceae bacterium]|nr:antibiotic biosynthesis monooxygenase [Hyphomonadaceae bacterium]